MMTGKEPFEGKLNHCRSKGAYLRLKYIPSFEVNPLVPFWADGAIRKALRYEPERRHQDISEFLYELQHPNPKYKKVNDSVLADRNPVLMWQIISGMLFTALCISLYFR